MACQIGLPGERRDVSHRPSSRDPNGVHLRPAVRPSVHPDIRAHKDFEMKHSRHILRSGLLTRGLVLALLLLSGPLPALLPAGMASASPLPCKGTSANFDSSRQKWVLSCGGPCGPQQFCGARSTTCNGVAMVGCVCAPNTCPPDTCCGVVLDSSGSPVTYGDCTSCPIGGGTCRLCGDTQQDPTSYSPSCLPCTYPL